MNEYTEGIRERHSFIHSQSYMCVNACPKSRDLSYTIRISPIFILPSILPSSLPLITYASTIQPSKHPSHHPPTHPSIHPPNYPPIHPPIHTPVISPNSFTC